MVTLPGNVRREANAANDQGAASGSLRLDHMLLQLGRPAARESELEAKIESLYQPGSPDFHHWLTATEFGRLYGPDPADIEILVAWLESHGFQINNVARSGMVIDFSGNVQQVESTFNPGIHNLQAHGKRHIANMRNPQIPAALANLVVGISSLNDFRPKPENAGISSGHIDPLSKAVVAKQSLQGGAPGFTVDSSYQLVVPDDIHTIYNFTPIYNKGITGRGQQIIVIEDTDVYSKEDWAQFRKTFLLAQYQKGSFEQIHPGGCTDPGIVAGTDAEAIIDAEYASAAAPDAAIEVASCADTQTTFGGLLALEALVDENAPPHIISLSYGECEAALGAAGNATYNYAYQQAASEGISVFVATGDEGAAGCDANEPVAQFGISVNGFASTPYNVAVGGTDYGDTYAGTNAQYWKAKDNAAYGSAKSYIPEIPWNDSCASSLITDMEGYGVPYGINGFCNSPIGEEYFLTTDGSSGGPSGCAYGETSSLANTPAVSGTCNGYRKPSYQNGVFGNPNDRVRDLPDVSLFAANGVWGHYYVLCYSDPTPGAGGAPCTGDPAGWSGGGGTSFAAPIVAGIQALINESAGTPQGDPNYVYYALARREFGGTGKNSCASTLGNSIESSCVFNDVAQGDMDVNCLGSFNCYDPSGPNGVLSVASKVYSEAYKSRLGWDFATGIGTLNVSNLVTHWDFAF
ncbi:MAG: S53 family peptidase [Acidobacteriaceae bacterium]